METCIPKPLNRNQRPIWQIVPRLMLCTETQETIVNIYLATNLTSSLFRSYRIPRTTRFACLSAPTSRVVRWRSVMRIFLACGLTASRTALPAFRSPVERKSLLGTFYWEELIWQCMTISIEVRNKKKIIQNEISQHNITVELFWFTHVSLFFPTQLGGLPVPWLPWLPVCVWNGSLQALEWLGSPPPPDPVHP